MTSRSALVVPPVVWLGILLSTLAVLIAWLKVDQLHMPLTPGEDSELWTVEARIDFDGGNAPAHVAFRLPEDSNGFTRVDESFVSRSFGLAVSDATDVREAVWTRRRAEGAQ